MHAGAMKHLTIRNVPEDLHEELLREKTRRGSSLNQTVIDLLRQRLGVSGGYSNGLRRFAGTWSEDEFQEFEKARREFENVDPELWQ